MKQVLITGGGSGIGEACAHYFHDKGWNVLLVGRTLSKLQAVQQQLGERCQVIAADLSTPEAIFHLENELKKINADVSVLVNNAGVYKASPFADEDSSTWDFHFENNLFGAVRLTKLVWSQLVRNKGSVVNVSSTLGLRPIENTGAYSASKAAMNSWTQSLALEAGPLGVRVNAICPGLTSTPIHAFHQSQTPELLALQTKLHRMQPLGRMGKATDIAAAVYFVSGPETPWMTGALIPVDGGTIVTTRDPL